MQQVIHEHIKLAKKNHEVYAGGSLCDLGLDCKKAQNFPSGLPVSGCGLQVSCVCLGEGACVG